MDQFEYMEVEEIDLPLLECLKPIPMPMPTPAVKNELITIAPAGPGNHRSRGQSICLVKPDPQPSQQTILLPQCPPRRQQTNEPTWMPDIDMSPMSQDQIERLPCAPTTDDLENIEPSFSFSDMPEDTKQFLERALQGGVASVVPGVPEVDPLAVITSSETVNVMLGQSHFGTITLLPERVLPSPNSATLSMVDHLSLDRRLDGDLIQELMAKSPEKDNISEPMATESSSLTVAAGSASEFDVTARQILDLHTAVTSRLPVLHSKKKPMLHEFLGYILFKCNRSSGTNALRGTVHFCNRNGAHQSTPSELFKVVNFDTVSEVWRRIKSNSSKEAIKNMKRAMRMSTSNDRQYFKNLDNRVHRQQIFSFGERSMEFFRLAFPKCFSSC